MIEQSYKCIRKYFRTSRTGNVSIFNLNIILETVWYVLRWNYQNVPSEGVDRITILHGDLMWINWNCNGFHFSTFSVVRMPQLKRGTLWRTYQILWKIICLWIFCNPCFRPSILHPHSARRSQWLNVDDKVVWKLKIKFFGINVVMPRMKTVFALGKKLVSILWVGIRLVYSFPSQRK